MKVMKKKLVFIFTALIICIAQSGLALAAGTLADLQGQVNAIPSGGTLQLTQDYAYNSGSGDPVGGVSITQAITIDGNGHTVRGGTLARIFTINAPGLSVTIKNLKVTEGFGTNGNTNTSASAILVSSGNVVFENCVVTDNGSVSDRYGASAIRINAGANVSFTGCEISYNRVSTSMDRGGGITTLGNVKFYNCVIKGNIGQGRGGGLYVDNGKVFMKDCAITGNEGVRGGGVNVSTNNDELNIFEDCLIENNKANPHFSSSNTQGAVPGDAGNGGGILSYRSKVLMKNCIIRNNEAKRGGGVGVDISDAVLNEMIFENCVISGNKAIHFDLDDDVFYGGGLVCLDGSQQSNPSTQKTGAAILSNNKIMDNFVINKDGVRWANDVHIHWTQDGVRDGGATLVSRYDGSILSLGGNKIGLLTNPKNFTENTNDKIGAYRTQLPEGHADEGGATLPALGVKEINGIAGQLGMSQICVVGAWSVQTVGKDDDRLSKDVKARTSHAVFIDQPVVESGDAAVIDKKNLVFDVNAMSLTGEVLQGGCKVMKYFENGESIDLLAAFGDKLFKVEEKTITLNKTLIIVDNVYKEPAFETLGSEKRGNAGIWLTEDYLYIFDGNKDGFARDPIVLEIADENEGDDGGNSGCNSMAVYAGVGITGVLAMVSLSARRKDKQ